LLYDLPEVTNKDHCVEVLQKALPRCDISFPYAQASEMPKKPNEVKGKK
jgi:hypothetical protein